MWRIRGRAAAELGADIATEIRSVSHQREWYTVHSTHRTAAVMWCVPCWSRIKGTRIVIPFHTVWTRKSKHYYNPVCSTMLYRGPTDDSERQLLRDTTHHTPDSTAQHNPHHSIHSSHRPLVECRGLQISPGIKGLGPWTGSESVCSKGQDPYQGAVLCNRSWSNFTWERIGKGREK